jgi:hypothetical protein
MTIGVVLSSGDSDDKVLDATHYLSLCTIWDKSFKSFVRPISFSDDEYDIALKVNVGGMRKD